MSDLIDLLLNTLTIEDKFDSLNLSDKLSIDHQKIVGAVKSLQSLGNVISSQQTSQTRWQLTPEGQEVMEKGSHEAVVFRNVPQGGIKQDELMSLVGSAHGKIGFSKAMSLNWISIDKKAEGGPMVLKKTDLIVDSVQEQCKLVRDNNLDQLNDQQRSELKKRKLITEMKLTSYVVSKGQDFTTNIEKQETELTQEMIMSGSWKTKQFKAYNFSAKGLDPHGGHLHPLLKVRTQFRQIFLEMGFTEMPTNNFVESSFWNFDSLFQPQQHPARDAHDTFFISDPEHAHEFPMEYLERVKKVHSVGGYGSLGYRYNWSELEASKNIMRTHTTGVSARMLYQLAIQPTFTPSKFFSIDRVFRNETLDATHLAEFHQIEGLVADYGLTLGDLMGYIQEFFKKYGIKKLKFKPAYNPYTEPSMEVFSYHEGLKKWVEIGNSGVFRPEMLLPMNLPPNVSVIAWGLSLERPTMIKYGIQNIRDLFGPRVDLQKIYDSPICRLGSSDSYITLMYKFPKEERYPDDVNDGDNKLEIHITKLIEMKQDRLIHRLKLMNEQVLQLNFGKSIDRSKSGNSSLDGCITSPKSKEREYGKKINEEQMSSRKNNGNDDNFFRNFQNIVESTQSQSSTGKNNVNTSILNRMTDDSPLIPLEKLTTLESSAIVNAENVYRNSKNLQMLASKDGNKGIVVYCDPIFPPLTLIIILKEILKYENVKCFVRVSTFSNLNEKRLAKLKSIFNTADSTGDNISNDVSEKRTDHNEINLVWQNIGSNPMDVFMVIDNHVVIKGETNIARSLPNLLSDKIDDELIKNFYETLENVLKSKIDEIIDDCTCAYFSNHKDTTEKLLKKLDDRLKLSTGPYIFNTSVTLADVVVWETLTTNHNANKRGWTDGIKNWMNAWDKLWNKYL